MDAYLCREAFQFLEALSLTHTKSNPDGLLIGHQRGCRFYVERAFSCGKGFFPSLKDFILLNQLFEDKILGFFSFYSEEKKVKKILAPIACGKLFLEIQKDKKKGMTIKPFIIEFNNEFILSPLQLRFPRPKDKKHGKAPE